MLQRNSSQPCYYVCLSPLLLVMRTGSQRRINLSEDLFTGSRPLYMCVLKETQENWLVLLTSNGQAFDPRFGLLMQMLIMCLAASTPQFVSCILLLVFLSKSTG